MKHYYGTVDIGGTKIMAGITDSGGIVHSREKFPTLELPVSETMDRILSCLEEQCARLSMDRTDLSGIGVVCAGPVDIQKGTVENPYTLPGWDHYPIAAELNQRSGLEVRLENDVNGALLGEIIRKDLRDKRVLMASFGTGIGLAFYADHALYRTGGPFHPELGHMVVSAEGETCYCGRRGCFESLWSGTALHRRAKAQGYADFDHLYQAWKDGDQRASDLIQKMKWELKTAVWNFGIVFQPDVVILGGGIMASYFPFAQETLQEDCPAAPDFVPPYQLLSADPEQEPALVGGMGLFEF